MAKQKQQIASTELALYTLRNQEGLWFRSKGYGGTGNNWVQDFSKAKLYSKIGPARGQISYYANHYPDYPAPTLVKLLIGQIVEIDETDRVEKQRIKKLEEQARRERREQEWQLKYAKERAKKALADVERLSSNLPVMPKPFL